MKKLHHGFTLIEIILVIMIIAIMTAIAIPAYQHYLTKARLAEVFSVASGLKPRIVESYYFNQTCPINNNGSNTFIEAPTAYATKIINDITVATGTSGCDIIITIKNDAPVAAEVKGKIINLHLISTNTSGAMAWQCVTTIPEPAKYLPASCVN